MGVIFRLTIIYFYQKACVILKNAPKYKFSLLRFLYINKEGLYKILSKNIENLSFNEDYFTYW